MPARILQACRTGFVDPPLTDGEARLLWWLQTGQTVAAVDALRVSRGGGPADRVVAPRDWYPAGLGPETQDVRIRTATGVVAATLVHLLRDTRVYHGTHRGVSADDVLDRPNFFGEWPLATMFADDYEREKYNGGGVVHVY